MNSAPTAAVDYAAAARRHLVDGRLLQQHERLANAGQLFGFSVECGLKALLLVCGVPADAEGGIPGGHKFRTHMPVLKDRIEANGQLVPDGALSARYWALLPGIGNLGDWSVDHRYWRESELPLGSIPRWESAAGEINDMLDQAREDGVIQ